MKEKVVIVPDFLSEDVMNNIIKFIDSNLDKFAMPQELRHVLMIGHQNGYVDGSHSSLNVLGEIKDIITNEYFTKLKQLAIDIFGDDGDSEISNLWISKQLPGSVLLYHHDDDNGYNSHFKYSCIMYLNTVDSGDLEFPELGFSYRPKAGDLVIFPSLGENMGHEIKEINHMRYSMPTWFAPKQYAL
jgi:hypothetical protein